MIPRIKANKPRLSPIQREFELGLFGAEIFGGLGCIIASEGREFMASVGFKFMTASVVLMCGFCGGVFVLELGG
jgi:hypothetical protein